MDAVVGDVGVVAVEAKALASVGDGFRNEAGGGHGEVAVDVKAVSTVVGVEGAFGGFEVGEGVGGFELGGDGGEESFVGVQVVAVVPVESGEAKVASEQ